MRRTLALVALAVTSMVALAFLVPLGMMVREIASDQAISDAERQAGVFAPVLATSTEPDSVQRALDSTRAGQAGRVSVHLPDGAVIGQTWATPRDLRDASDQARADTVPVPGGKAFLQPVTLDHGKTAVAEVFVPDSEMQHGVLRSWLVLAAVGIVLVAGSVVVADRLAARIVRSATGLAAASAALGQGDFAVRVEPSGPSELQEAGHAFNTMAGRVRQLLAAEREMIADLSHRLRTPLTALRLNAEALGDDQVSQQTRLSVQQLEREVDAVINSARSSGEDGDVQVGCDVAEVLRERSSFWSALAEDQQRHWQLLGAAKPVRVPVPRSEFVAAADAAIGNVFRHTAERVSFAVSVRQRGGVVTVIVEDGGQGIAESEIALQRGSSGAGSSGLGLDIVRRVAESAGGAVHLDRSRLGGARVRMTLRQYPSGPRRGRRATPLVGRRRRSRRSR